MSTTEDSALIRGHRTDYGDLTDEYDEAEPCLPCNPKRRLHRYMVLPLICMLSFGSYFCFDNPSALEDVIMKDLRMNALQYENLYSFYSWPNVVLSFVGGYLIDRVFGIRLGAILFAAFCFVGQILFASGALIDSIGLIYFARFVFGIGGESLAVAQNTYSTKWFDSTEINLIFGLQLSISRIGSTINFNVMGPIYEAFAKPRTYKTLGYALFIAAISCLISLAIALVLAFLDRRANRILSAAASTSTSDDTKLEKASDDDNNAAGESAEPPKIKLSDVLHFGWGFWIITATIFLFYAAVFPFITLAKVYFINKFSMTPPSAALAASLVYIVGAVASPLFGITVDRLGRNCFFVIGACVAALGCHLLFMLTYLNPIATCVIFGFAYSLLASSLWPMFSYILPQHHLGTAFGLAQSLQNLGLGLVSLIAGYFQDNYGYLMLELFFTLCMCGSIVTAMALYMWDIGGDPKVRPSTLNISAVERRRRQYKNVDL